MIFDVIDLFMHEGDMGGDVAGGNSPFQPPVLVIAIKCARRGIVLGIGDKEVACGGIDRQTIWCLYLLRVLGVEEAVANLLGSGAGRVVCSKTVGGVPIGVVGGLVVVNLITVVAHVAYIGVERHRVFGITAVCAFLEN